MSDYFSIKDDKNGGRLNIDVDVQEKAWLPDIDLLKSLMVQATRVVILQVGLYKYVNDIEFSIILTNDHLIQELNLQYRGKNKPTNTLSFPAQDLNIKEIDKIKFHDRFVILGDVIFAYEVIAHEAKEQNKSFNDHFVHLLIHSLLHLLGFDHEAEEEAEEMEKIEIALLAALGIDSPYI